jgi:ABC-type branched-subunit amino acid transport system substrate-binding protein
VNELAPGSKLHGLYLVPGDLPTTIQGATSIVASMERAGVAFDDVLKVSTRAPQTAYTPLIQAMKEHDANFVYDGSNDSVMVALQKEAAAQGFEGVKLWTCSLSCYTKAFLSSGGAVVEGTYAWMQFLPFEEKGANEELAAYLDGVGESKANSFGAQAWQAGVLFKQVVDGIVAEHGPNGITRSKILEGLERTEDFTANGWIGKKDLRGTSPCFVMLKVEHGAWVRVHPKEVGTFDCDADNIVQVSLDPAVAATKMR